MKQNIYTIWLLLFLLLPFHNITSAQKKTGHTDTLIQRYAAATFSRYRQNGPLLVAFTAIPSGKLLEKCGLIKALTRYHYILQQLPADSNDLKKIVYCYAANSNWKATQALLQLLEITAYNDSVIVQIAYVANGQPIVYAHIINNFPKYNAAVVSVKKQDWPAFIEQPAILLADIVKHPSTEIIINASNLAVNRINIAQQQFPGIRGKSVTVSVKEDLFDTTDIDLKGKYITSTVAATRSSLHATIMATLIGGAGNSGTKGAGVAPDVMLSSANFDVSLFPNDSSYFRHYAITVQNHSYGTGIENYYGAEAAAYDQQVIDADTIVHVFSSGNIGSQSPNAGRYQNIRNYANLSGNFKQAKNILVTGGTDNLTQVTATSSRGPAFDGRIKPEITAYGEDGTSGAAALTSGVVALLQNAWRQQFNGSMPAALVKAIIINSALRSRGSLPAYDQGYGNLHAQGALQTVKENRFRKGIVTPGATTAFDIDLPAGLQQVKVTLYWNDPPAVVNAAKALVNDLDLTASDDHTTYLPWVLNNYPAKDSLAMVAHRGVDSINNTEQISIEHPNAGKLHLSIRGSRLATTSQTFYLAFEFIPLQSFEWQNPAPGNILEAAQPASLQWQTTYSGKGDLSYSLDSGINWLPIAQQISIEQGTYNWIIPNIFQQILLKLTLTDTSFISAPCVVAPMLTLNTGFNCRDTALIYWNKQPGAIAYQLYILGERTLIPYAQSTDTFLLIAKAQAASPYFAISPIAAAGWTGARSYAFNYTQQGVSCYVKNLLADKTTDNNILLSLNIGSIYQLKNLYWEKLSRSGWITLHTQPVDNTVNYNYLDDHVEEGLVTFRVRLETVDGRNIYSDPVSVEIFLNNHILLFPNPASAQLYILDDQARDRKAIITNMSGHIVLQRHLENTQEIIPVDQLVNGIYNCSIYINGKQIYRKLFIKMK